jgi:RNA polymerase sigma factor (sigma-70 family)
MNIDQLQHHTDEQVNLHDDQYSVFMNEYMLWKSFKEGDLGAYAVIYREYFFVLYQYGKKICYDHGLVEDSIQDLFIKIWHNRKNLKDTTSIKYYLLTSLRRKILDTLRSRGSRINIQVEDDFWDKSRLDVSMVEEDAMLEQKEAILKALNRLSSHQQKLLHLKFYKNFTNKEIAEEMGITIQSVYNAVFESLKSLREQFSVIVFAIILTLLK